MKNTYAIFVAGDEYTCTEFFDTDKGEGIDVKDALTQKHIVEVFGLTIPDLDATENEIETFENVVTEWIEDNL
jgi:hypothetical protein